jgi:hypothetical protein
MGILVYTSYTLRWSITRAMFKLHIARAIGRCALLLLPTTLRVFAPLLACNARHQNEKNHLPALHNVHKIAMTMYGEQN